MLMNRTTLPNVERWMTAISISFPPAAALSAQTRTSHKKPLWPRRHHGLREPRMTSVVCQACPISLSLPLVSFVIRNFQDSAKENPCLSLQNHCFKEASDMISRPPPLSGPNRLMCQPQPRYVDVTYLSCLPTSTYSVPSPINIIHRAQATMRDQPVPLFVGPTASARALLTAATSTATVRVEHLQRPPRLFAPIETVPTNVYVSAASITCRVGKAWSASVGASPVWQIVDDLGWFREAEQFMHQGGTVAQAASESKSESGQALARQVVVCDECARRPRVHADAALLEGWSLFCHVECVFLPPLPPPLSPSILVSHFLPFKPCVGVATTDHADH